MPTLRIEGAKHLYVTLLKIGQQTSTAASQNSFQSKQFKADSKMNILNPIQARNHSKKLTKGIYCRSLLGSHHDHTHDHTEYLILNFSNLNAYTAENLEVVAVKYILHLGKALDLLDANFQAVFIYQLTNSGKSSLFNHFTESTDLGPLGVLQ